MKKAMLITIFQILIATLLLNGPLLADEVGIDESFDEKTYNDKGVPEKIQNLDDFASVYNSFLEIAEKNKNNLPRYNSKKSGKLFLKLFNKGYVDNIIKSDRKSQQKRELLSKYSLMYSGFTDIYSLNNLENLYENEIIRLSSLKAYSMMSAYKIFDQEISDNHLKLSEVFEKPEEKVMFIAKMIGREFWGLNFTLNKLDTIDSVTKAFIRTDIEMYEKLVASIKFLDYENNIKKIKSLY